MTVSRASDSCEERAQQSVVSLFSRQAALQGNKAAIRFEGRCSSFSELDLVSNRVARRILQAEGQGNRPVVALLREGLMPPAVLLGALKANKGYVPLDAAHESSRMEQIIRDSTAASIVVDASTASTAARVGGCLRLINLHDATGVSDGPIAVKAAPGDLAAIIYTSGSTGAPKGVIQTRAELGYSVSVLSRELDPEPQDRVLVLASFAFAGGLKPALRATLAGATVIVGGTSTLGSLPEVMISERVTWLSSSPSVLRHLMQTLPPGLRLPDLRMVFMAHEPLLRRDLERFREIFGDVPLRNTLGTTETSMFRSFLATAAAFEGDTVPVGYQIADMEVVLLDGDGRRVRPGEEGQIAVKGSRMSSGYWRRPDLTAERFVTDPLDGRRIYLTGDMGKMLPEGRLDPSWKARLSGHGSRPSCGAGRGGGRSARSCAHSRCGGDRPGR